MIVRSTETYKKWFKNLRDRQARMRIDARLYRLHENGYLGDHRNLSGGVIEMRIDYGPGYRVYATQKGSEIILLLVGGDKRTQQRDIETAQEMARELKGEDHG
ncbi:MAG: type II toxin-antitoxin system RelE/ParE family toxin [Coriobacteriia bacterium]|nr:type II toxin-antitoxin system RelE/ParE family toxin [Coriobacteriia bacterium]